MNEQTKNIEIIPARGGSKRIPRKNIKDFPGKPIIAYSMEAPIDSNLDNKVMVSTNDEEILNILKKYSIRVIRENSSNSGSVEIWGSGLPLREFLWSEEMAYACVSS